MNIVRIPQTTVTCPQEKPHVFAIYIVSQKTPPPTALYFE